MTVLPWLVCSRHALPRKRGTMADQSRSDASVSAIGRYSPFVAGYSHATRVAPAMA
jgi:hypothetical protein